jgi:hypothetical protein
VCTGFVFRMHSARKPPAPQVTCLLVKYSGALTITTTQERKQQRWVTTGTWAEHYYYNPQSVTLVPVTQCAVRFNLQ